jgi:prolipoprotein diacylglyceryl transferase
VLFASIPSPGRGVIDLGPVPLHAYGLMLALGIIAATLVTEKRWATKGHDPREIGAIAVPVVISGIVGARVYHLFTGYRWREGGIVGAFQIWEGGLSIWGAVGGGALAAVVLARRHGLDVPALLDAIAPGLALAQAIGRWGNYFNQELFGRPTDLPWALEIDLEHRPAGYLSDPTFHPTFLYESLWCLSLAGALVWAERRFRLQRGQTFALYVALYTFARVGLEALRIDEATKVFGIRFNLLLSAVLCAGAVVAFVRLGRRHSPEAAEPAEPRSAGSAP